MQMCDRQPLRWVAPPGPSRTPQNISQIASAATELFPSQSTAQTGPRGPSTRDPVASPAAPRGKGGLVAGIAIGAIVATGPGFFWISPGNADRSTAASPASATVT